MAFLALDPANKNAGIALANLPWETQGNLLATTTLTTGWGVAVGTVSQSSGKWYWEWTIAFPNNGAMMGLGNASVSLTTWLGNTANSFGLENNGSTFGVGGTPGWSASIPADRIGMAVDVTAKKFWLRKNGGAWLNGDPVAGTGGGTYTVTGAVFPCIALAGFAAVTGLAFVGACAIGGSSHAFAAAPPTGYSAWGDTSTFATPTQAFDTGWQDTTTTLSGANQIATFNTGPSGANSGWRSQLTRTLITAGRYYFETAVNAVDAGVMVGIVAPLVTIQDWLGDNGSTVVNTGSCWHSVGDTYINGTKSIGAVASFTTGDVICAAVDVTLKKLWMRKNGGSWIGGSSPNPTTGVGGYDMTTLMARANGFLPAVSGRTAPVLALNAAGPFSFDNPFGWTTWDPANKSGITLSNANLTAASTNSLAKGVTGIQQQSYGRYYFEFTATTFSIFANVVGIAIPTVNVATVVNTYVGLAVINQGGGSVCINSASGSGVNLGAIANGDLICCAVDLPAQRIWFRKGAAGNWNANATYDPGTGVGGVSFAAIGAAPYVPFLTYNGGGQASTVNFGGQAFSGAVPSGFTAGWPSTLTPAPAATASAFAAVMA